MTSSTPIATEHSCTAFKEAAYKEAVSNEISVSYAGRKLTSVGAAAIQAQQIINAANQRTEIQISQAKGKIVKRAREIFLRARDRGLKNGAHAAEKIQIQKLLELEKQYHEAFRKTQAECIQIALTVAETVIAETIKTPQIISKRINQQLKKYSTEKITAISINPSDIEHLTEVFPQQVKVNPDPTIAPGDLKLQNTLGSIQVNWRAHFEAIKNALIERFENLKSRTEGENVS